MKYLSYLFVAAMLLLQSNAAIAATELNPQEHANLISAIEDYRFSDYEAAIPKLVALHNKAPQHLSVLQHLALSYAENNQPNKAVPLFQAWLKNSGYMTDESSRFAWLGLGSAYAKLGQDDEAIAALETWTKANPNDIDPMITLGDLYARQQQYTNADLLWNTILNNTEARSNHKAAAWYYKAWMAYAKGDNENVQVFADKSLQLDPEGAYASTAKKLKAMPPQKQGFYGSASIEPFYNSNIQFVPDSLTSSKNGDDAGVQSNLSLGWKSSNIDINYILSSTIHENLNDYDLLFHALSATWISDAFRFKPSYEHVSLNDEYLYQSLGLGVYYTQQAWTYQYTGKFKTFSNAFGAGDTDLERLGGSSHRLSVQTPRKISSISTLLSAHFIAELTKGDATHDKSDSYFQLGGDATVYFPLADNWKTQIKLELYSRQYTAADTNILLSATDTTKRLDTFTKVSSSTSWQPWKDYNVSFLLNLAYQQNVSNYDETLVTETSSKTYSGWRVGTSVVGKW